MADFVDVPGWGEDAVFMSAGEAEKVAKAAKGRHHQQAAAKAAKVQGPGSKRAAGAAVAEQRASKKPKAAQAQERGAGARAEKQAGAAPARGKSQQPPAAACEAPQAPQDEGPSGKNLGRRRRAREKRDRERAARAGGGAPPVELADGVAAVAAEPRRQKKKAAQEQAAPQHPPCGPAPSEEERLRALKRQKLKDKRNLQRGGGSADAVGAEQAAPPLAPAAPPAKKAKATLLQKAQAQLSGGHFRWLNQELYTRPGVEALQLMSSQPDLFAQYHSGFRSQTAAWPVQPLDVCIAWLRRCPAWWTVADVGCGDARLALSAAQRVHSFDLVAVTPAVQACDMCALPLPDAALQAAVFCLSLMGTDYGRALQEAHRCLEARGTLWIAEVRSRFEGAAGGVDAFLGALQTLGFSLKARDESNTMFAVFRLVKGDQPQGKPQWPKLKACEYKKR